MRLLLVLALFAAPAQAQESPDVLVKNVTLEVVELITKDKEIQAGNRAKLIAGDRGEGAAALRLQRR